ncbi:hypothetical protein [Uliginosibacterium paludis]|uniref:hypothetical protein n=1 Tax=Uliginosibacterium paludis TaxID=1615952 RepID=UPI0031F67C4E
MKRITEKCSQNAAVILCSSALLLPFACELLTDLLYQATAIRLRDGDGILLFLGTGFTGLLGFLLLLPVLYRDFKTGRRPALVFTLLASSLIALCISAVILLTMGRNAFCGGPLSECGRWI